MSSATWATKSSFGTWNPQECLVAVVDDPSAALQARDAPCAAGFRGEDVRDLSARDLLAIREGNRRARTWFARLACFFADLSDAALFEAEYREEARSGRRVMVIHAPRTTQVPRARAILQRGGARALRYYGRWVITCFVVPSPRTATVE